jgi:hypothetical protein
VTRGTSGPLERVVGGKASRPLLARADHVEQRVVQTDRHPDQQHNGLDAGVEREDLADRSEQAEGRRSPRSPRAKPGRPRRRARQTRSAGRAGSPARTGARRG